MPFLNVIFAVMLLAVVIDDVSRSKKNRELKKKMQGEMSK